MDLNEIDRRLLAALKSNARASVTELAATLGAARNTVKQRLDRLVETGVIRGFTIETDAGLQDQIRAITTIELQGSMSRSVIRALHAAPEIVSLHSTNGAWDLVAEITVDDLQGIDRILGRIREIPGVLKSETSLLLRPV